MARTRFGIDRGLTARMFATMFGLGLLYVILGGVLLALGVGAIFVLVIMGALDLRAVVVLRLPRARRDAGPRSLT